MRSRVLSHEKVVLSYLSRLAREQERHTAGQGKSGPSSRFTALPVRQQRIELYLSLSWATSSGLVSPPSRPKVGSGNILNIANNVLSVVSVSPPPSSGSLHCALFESKQQVGTGATADSGEHVVETHGEKVARCLSTDLCYSYWTTDTDPQDNTTHIKWIKRGCGRNWPNCNQSTCVATPRPDGDFFCCCRGHMCNSVVHIEQPTTTPVAEVQATNHSEEDMMLWIIVISIAVFVVIVSILTAVLIRFRQTKPQPNLPEVEEKPSSPCIDLESVKFLESIGQGRYGTVYRAMVRDEVVAVKLFPQHYKASYQNEKYIYSLPLMEHTNLLSYLGGGDQVRADGNLYYGIVLSYCPKGRLSSYLAENTLDWPTFCHIVLTATRGLAHLHSDIRKGDLVKPCVSHRDFNTRNLLLKNEMSCVVSDLGFAIHTQGSKYYINGEEQHAETSSLTDVGTLRYMAPEVLEGAVNLRDCEAALKQIDIYALGLVLWECAARCHDLYQGLQTPPYKLPFQAEIGLHPTFEQVQVLVARNKARPLFPTVWKDSNPAIRLLKETIEDCWDHDAEARLSAMCVEGRLSDLPLLWDRYKASLNVNGISPSINPMSSHIIQRPNDILVSLGSNGGRIINNPINNCDKDSSVSEATVETTLSGSPSEPLQELLFGKNHLLSNLQQPVAPLQPHQGRNPCMERNLIREITQELTVAGNTLIDNLNTDQNNSNDINSLNAINSANLLDGIDMHQALDAQVLTNEHLVPLLNSQSNVSVSAAPRPTPPVLPPIPYVQNDMRTGEGQPKRQNTAQEVRDCNFDGRGSSWKRLKVAWEDKLRKFLPHRRNIHNEDEERQEILVTPTSSSVSEPPTPLNTTILPTSNININVNSQLPLQTQVLLTNGGPHTVISPNHAINVNYSPVNINHIAETEIGIAKLQLQNGFTPVIRSRQGSKDSGLNKSSENSFSFMDSDNSCEKLKRPTTLSLSEKKENDLLAIALKQSIALSQSDQNVAADKTPSPDAENCDLEFIPVLRPAKQRVKTPRHPINPRLSLYDDRIMSWVDGQQLDSVGDHLGLDETLSHSLPLHMNMLHHTQQQEQRHQQQNQQKNILCSTENSSACSSASQSSSSLSHSKAAAASSSNSSSSDHSNSLSSQSSLGQNVINAGAPHSKIRLTAVV
ncbi:unnamed protein product, partial [Meganyctiphanes norvegica]